MTDVSARVFTALSLHKASSPGIVRRLVAFQQADATPRTDVARPQQATAGLPAVSAANAAMAVAVMEWLRQTPGHWRGRALARRELAGTAFDDAEQREHIAMADLYDRLSLSREALSPVLPSITDVDRWRWRPSTASAIPDDAAGEGRHRGLESGI